MDEQLEFVKLIGKRLDEAGIEYMITGSVAMAIYSVPRMTRDIDLVVKIGKKDIYKLVNLFSRDCYIDEISVKEAIRERGMFNIIHNEWILKADFIIRKDTEYRVVEFARKNQIDIDGNIISIVAPEDLILSKLEWGKSSLSNLQLNDVREMIKSVEGLDWNYINKWAKVLGVDDLLEKAVDNE